MPCICLSFSTQPVERLGVNLVVSPMAPILIPLLRVYICDSFCLGNNKL